MIFLNTQNILSFCCAHFFGLLTLVVAAQPEGVTWQHTLGAESFEWAGGLDKNESEYVVCGYSNSTTNDFSNNVGGYDMYIATVDNQGAPLLFKSFGSTGYDEANDVVSLTQGGFAVIGLVSEYDGDITISDQGSTDCWLGIFDNELNLTQQLGFGGNLVDEGTALIQTTDGGLLLTGFTSSTSDPFGAHLGFEDVFLVKLDSDWNLQWSGNYGGSASERPTDIVEVSDGFVISAHSSSLDGDVASNAGNLDAWVFKVDLEGQVVWSTTMGGSSTDQAESLIERQDGFLAIAGFSNSEDGDFASNIGGRDATVAILSSDGNLEILEHFGTSVDDYFYALTQDSDGTLTCLGNTAGSFGLGGLGGSDYYLVNMSAELQTNWQEIYGGSIADGGYHILSDGDGYVLFGEHYGNDGDILSNNGAKDVSLLRVGELMMVEGCTDPAACNFNPDANSDDGSCDYLPVFEISGDVSADVGMEIMYNYPGDSNSSYLWEVVGGSIISGQGSNSTTINWTDSGLGSVCVTETAADGCQGIEVCIDVDVQSVSTNDLIGEALKLGPNPTKGTFWLTISAEQIGAECVVYDNNGGRVYRQLLMQETTVMNLDGLASGVYTVVLIVDEIILKSRVLIE